MVMSKFEIFQLSFLKRLQFSLPASVDWFNPIMKDGLLVQF